MYSLGMTTEDFHSLERRQPRFAAVPGWRGKHVIESSERPAQASQQPFYDWAVAKGYAITRKAWPDWCVLDDQGEPVLVQILEGRGRAGKKEQLHLLRLLACYGVPCFQWSDEGGLVRICGDDPFPEPEPPY